MFAILFIQAEEMAQTFRQRIAQAEAMARADMLRFQPEVHANAIMCLHFGQTLRTSSSNHAFVVEITEWIDPQFRRDLGPSVF